MPHPAATARFAYIACGGQPVFSPTANERTTRCLVVAMFAALPLFVAIELSPTAWALTTTAFVVATNFGLLIDGLGGTWWRLAAGWIGLAAFAACSALWSLDPIRSVHSAFVFGAFAACGAVLVGYVAGVTEAQRDRIWRSLESGAMIALVMLTAIEIYGLMFRWDVAGSRTLHKITFYGLLAAAILLHGWNRKLNARGIFLLVFFAIPTLLIGRTTGVALMIGLAAAMLLLRVRRVDLWLLAIFAIFCLTSLTAPLTIGPVFALAERIPEQVLELGMSAMARLDLWHLMSPYILAQPWLGHGADTVRISEFIIRHGKYYDLPDIPSAHNMMFDQWYELGLVGVVALLAVQGAMLGAILRSRCRLSLSVAIIALGFLVEFSVDHRIWLSWVQGTAIFAAMAVALMAFQANDQSTAA